MFLNVTHRYFCHADGVMKEGAFSTERFDSKEQLRELLRAAVERHLQSKTYFQIGSALHNPHYFADKDGQYLEPTFIETSAEWFQRKSRAQVAPDSESGAIHSP